MDGKFSWVVSIAMHGLLLLGAALTALDHFVLGDGEGKEGGTGFICRLGNPVPKFDRIERPKERFAGRIPSAEGPVLPENITPVDHAGIEMEQWRWSCCDCGCGGAATTLVAWPRDIMNYYDRKLSVATSRRGVPRLKTHSLPCAFRDTGIESDCTCGLIPPRS